MPLHEALAEALRSVRPDKSWLAEYDQWSVDVNAIANALQADPLFDRADFILSALG